jgi:hypothetical protein
VAKQIVVIDDVTGESNAETRSLTIDGVDYEIDLTDASMQRLKDQIREFLEVARVASPRSSSPRSSSRSAGLAAPRSIKRGTPVRKAQVLPSPSSTIRVWASANNVDCPTRGRIPASVIEAYERSMAPVMFSAVQ